MPVKNVITLRAGVGKSVAFVKSQFIEARHIPLLSMTKTQVSYFPAEHRQSSPIHKIH